MAMNSTVMGTAVKDAIKAEMATQGLPAWATANEADAEAFWQAICGAIITHIAANATVAVINVDTVGSEGGDPESVTRETTGALS